MRTDFATLVRWLGDDIPVKRVGVFRLGDQWYSWEWAIALTRGEAEKKQIAYFADLGFVVEVVDTITGAEYYDEEKYAPIENSLNEEVPHE